MVGIEKDLHALSSPTHQVMYIWLDRVHGIKYSALVTDAGAISNSGTNRLYHRRERPRRREGGGGNGENSERETGKEKGPTEESSHGRELRFTTE
jgi:hypothetical protein